MRQVLSVTVFALALVAGFGRDAAAQGNKVDFSAGYQFLHFFEEGENLKIGWGASAAVGKEWVKFVFDVAGHYLDDFKMHTFQGGVEFSGKRGRIVPFGRFLSGAAIFSENGTNSAFVLTPEGGVKIMVNDRAGLQASVGFPYLTNGEESANTFRFFVGFVMRK